MVLFEPLVIDFGNTSVLEGCVNWYYLNRGAKKKEHSSVLEGCVNWYYLNLNVSHCTAENVLEGCVNWYYLNEYLR